MPLRSLWPGIGDVAAARLIGILAAAADPSAAIDLLGSEISDRPEILSGLKMAIQHWDDPPTAIRSCGKFLEPVVKDKYANWESRRKDYELLARVAANYTSLPDFIEAYSLDPIETTSTCQLAQDDCVMIITIQ